MQKLIERLNTTMNVEAAKDIKLWHFLVFCFYMFSSGLVVGVSIALGIIQK